MPEPSGLWPIATGGIQCRGYFIRAICFGEQGYQLNIGPASPEVYEKWKGNSFYFTREDFPKLIAMLTECAKEAGDIQ
jgi:hypothetical protein